MASGIIEKLAVYESYATETKENNDFSISKSIKAPPTKHYLCAPNENRLK